MWNAIRLQNFKGYKDTQLQGLRPLTVLIGPNGGGKSTMLKFFMVLKQTLESTDSQTALLTNVEEEKDGYIDIGQYKDYIHMGDKARSFKFALKWDPDPNPRRGERSKAENQAAIEVGGIKVGFEQRAPRNQVVVSNLTYLDAASGNPLVSLDRGQRGAYSLEMAKDWKGDRLAAAGNKFYEPQKFYRFSPTLLADLPTATEARLRNYVSEFEDRLSNTFYLGPLREYPKRYYLATGERPDDLGLKGKKIGTVLYNEANSELMRQANYWLKELDIADRLELSRISKGNLFSVEIVGKNQRHSVNITDYGFGASQILPVILESIYAPEGATVLIEQPEIHLNAHHQLKLPNFFASMIRTGAHARKQFIIETHSEYFLKRLSTLIAKGELSPEDIAVYYCSASESGSQIRRIDVDEKGRFAWWPKDFLTEGYEGTVEHIDAMQPDKDDDDSSEEL